MAWLIVAGVLAFAAFLFLTAYAPPMRAQSGAFSPLSKNAIGFAGLMRLVESVTREQVATLQDNEAYNEPGLVIVPLAPDSDANAIRSFAAQRARNVPNGATLFILPKWKTQPVSLFSERVQRTERVDHAELNDLASALGSSVMQDAPAGNARPTGIVGVDRPAPVAPIAIGRMDDDATIVPLLTLHGPNVLLARLTRFRGGAVYLLSDPDLLANHALGSAAGARAALAIVAAVRPAADAQIAIDPEPARGGAGSTRNLLQLMFEPPFLALTLAVLAAAIMTGFHAFGRFGPALPEARAIAFGKRALIDNSARLFARAGAVKRLGDRYVMLTREAAAARLGATTMAPDALEAWLASLTRGHGDFAQLAAAARGAKDDAALRAAAAALHQWKDGVLRDRY